MKPYFLLTILILNWSSFNAMAEMYKWVDEEGNIQYTQTPPPEGTEATTVNPRLNSVSEGKSAPPAAAGTADSKESSAANSNFLKNCDEANKQIQQLNSESTLVVPDPANPGKFIPMPAATRQQQVTVAKIYLSQNQGPETTAPTNIKPSTTDQVDANSPAAKCEQARQQLAETESNPDLVVQDPQNPSLFIPLTEEARKQRVTLLKANIQRFCQN